MIPRTLTRLVALLAAAACGGTEPIATPKPEHTGPSTTIARFEIRDSVRTVIATPLVVTVIGPSGRPLPNVQVTASAVYLAATLPSYTEPIFFATVRELSGVPTMIAWTDSLGVVRFWLRANNAAGPFRIRMSSVYGRDSLDGVLVAGRSHHFAVTTRDTALFAGASFAPSFSVFDRPGNPTGEPISLTPRRPAVLDVAGKVVVARGTGRAYVVLTAGEARDSLAVSVVPPGNLIAYARPYASDDRPAFFMFALDGSGYRRLGESPSVTSTRSPQWSGALQRLLYHGSAPTASNIDALSLLSLPLTGAPSVVLSADVVAVGESAAKQYASATHPSVTPDGSWIYFSGTMGYHETGIWRVRPDGTGASRVGPATSVGAVDIQPSVAPDGRHVVYVTERGNFATGATRLMMLDVDTRVSLSMATLGSRPSWSPVADEIAFFANGVSIVRPDGTGEMVLARASFDARDGQLAWSPDGKWLVTCVTGQFSGDRQIVLIERATGEVLPLAYTAKDKLCEGTWKP